MTGHLLGGAGSLEAGLTVLTIRDQVAPPTTNVESLCEEERGLILCGTRRVLLRLTLR
nr:hypothetical protein [Acidisarcina polymorpha]